MSQKLKPFKILRFLVFCCAQQSYISGRYDFHEPTECSLYISIIRHLHALITHFTLSLFHPDNQHCVSSAWIKICVTFLFDPVRCPKSSDK